MKKEILRRKDGEWCQLEVELSLTRAHECSCGCMWEAVVEMSGSTPNISGEKTQWCPECGAKPLCSGPWIPGRLSICGSAGQLKLADDLREEALQYWVSFFEESPEELGDMFVRFQDNMIRLLQDADAPKRTAEEAAAQHVLDVDGEFHGLDIEGNEDADGNYRTVESCGQIREELAEWFPEVVPWFKWHLNDMKASCEHQEALGWNGTEDIALARKNCTPIQLEVLDRELAIAVEKRRIAYINACLFVAQRSDLDREDKNKIGHKLHLLLKDVFVQLNTEQVEILRAMAPRTHAGIQEPWTIATFIAAYEDPKGILMRMPSSGTGGYVREGVLVPIMKHLIMTGEQEYSDRKFESKIFEKGLEAPCPECGYRYGTAWLKRELPAEVVDWFESLDELED